MPRLRWEDGIKEGCEEGRRGRKLEEEDRRQRRGEKLSDEAVKKLRAAPHP